MSRPYYIHIRPKNVQTNCKGGITIAVQGNEDHGFTYAVARCSANDNYHKSFGRELAKMRLNERVRRIHLNDDIKSMREAESLLRAVYTV
jgi:hypothetical protein